MGCFGSTASKTVQDENKQIDLRKYTIYQKEDEYRAFHRLLLLGVEETGKSTIVNQIKLQRFNGFSQEETQKCTQIIRENILNTILIITEAMSLLTPSIQFCNPESLQSFKYIQSVKHQQNFNFPIEFYEHVDTLWKDSGVQECYKRSNEYQLTDNAKYFLDQIHNISDPDYVPSDQDILRSHVAKCGTLETIFKIDGVTFHIAEVSGRRLERRKWVLYFHDITAIIFVADCNSYDQYLHEDPTQLRLRESVDVFNSIWNNRWLQTISTILYLNKQDLLEEKIKTGRSKLEHFFPEFSDYQPPDDVIKNSTEDVGLLRAKYFIRDMFTQISSRNASEKHVCYPHFTCAINTEGLRKVFKDSRDIIRHIYLRQYKLL